MKKYPLRACGLCVLLIASTLFVGACGSGGALLGASLAGRYGAAVLPTLAVLEQSGVRRQPARLESELRFRVRSALADKRAGVLVAAMSRETVAAQVLLTGLNGTEGLPADTKTLLAEIPAGGAMLFKYNLGNGAGAAQSLAGNIYAALRSGAKADGKYADGSLFVPPFIAADQEGGLVHRYGDDATRLPAAAAFGQWSEGFANPVEGRARLRALVEGAAYRSGRELGLLGMNLNLAPVAETLDDRSLAFLDTRAYSRDGETAGIAAGAFVQGMRKAGIACVVKHFPGNAAMDPHLGMPVLDLDEAALDALFVSFGIAIRQGNPAALMVSHIMVPALDPVLPASLSPVIIDRVLRKRLQYGGLVVCDDLRMGAIRATGREPAQAAVEALAAGVDLVLTWKEDLALLRDALVSAMEKGDLDEIRVRDAARRVLAVKLAYGIYDGQASDPLASMETELARLRSETERYLKEHGL